MMLANDMEVERDHALDRGAPVEIDPMVEGLDDHLLEEANREERAPSSWHAENSRRSAPKRPSTVCF